MVSDVGESNKDWKAPSENGSAMVKAPESNAVHIETVDGGIVQANVAFGKASVIAFTTTVIVWFYLALSA